MSFNALKALGKTVSVVIPAGTTQIISFRDRFLGPAISIKLQNNDIANNATYRVNGESRPLLTLRADDSNPINGTIVDLLEITAGAAGSVQVEAVVQPLVGS